MRMPIAALCLLLVTPITLQVTASGAAHTIPGVPHVLQKPDFCGEACVSMALQLWGKDISQDEVWSRSGLPQDAGRGCWTPDLHRALQSLGIETPSPWISLPATAPENRAEMQRAWNEIKEQITGGIPVLVCMLSDESEHPSEHFRLLVGFDSEARTVIYHDPAVEQGQYMKMPLDTFAKLWPLKDGRGGADAGPLLSASSRRCSLVNGRRVERDGGGGSG